MSQLSSIPSARQRDKGSETYQERPEEHPPGEALSSTTATRQTVGARLVLRRDPPRVPYPHMPLYSDERTPRTSPWKVEEPSYVYGSLVTVAIHRQPSALASGIGNRIEPGKATTAQECGAVRGWGMAASCGRPVIQPAKASPVMHPRVARGIVNAGGLRRRLRLRKRASIWAGHHPRCDLST